MEKKADTLLAHALISLCAEKNYGKITVGDISQKAGINRQTFYYHFKDKSDLLRYTYGQCGLDFLAGKVYLKTWEESVLNMLKKMRQYHVFYSNTVSADSEVFAREFTRLAKRLFIILFNGVDHGQELLEKDKEFYARFLSYGCVGILIDWILTGTEEAPVTVAAQMFQFAKDIEVFAYRLYEKN